MSQAFKSETIPDEPAATKEQRTAAFLAEQLANQTLKTGEMVAAGFPRVLANTMQVNSSVLPRLTSTGVGAGIGDASPRRVTIGASPEKEKETLNSLSRIGPPLASLRVAADAVIAASRGSDRKAFAQRVGELERLLAALPPSEETEILLPTEGDAYKRTLENSATATKLFRQAVTAGNAGGTSKAYEFLGKATSLFNGPINTDGDFLQKRFDELKQKYP